MAIWAFATTASGATVAGAAAVTGGASATGGWSSPVSVGRIADAGDAASASPPWKISCAMATGGRSGAVAEAEGSDAVVLMTLEREPIMARGFFATGAVLFLREAGLRAQRTRHTVRCQKGLRVIASTIMWRRFIHESGGATNLGARLQMRVSSVGLPAGLQLTWCACSHASLRDGHVMQNF